MDAVTRRSIDLPRPMIGGNWGGRGRLDGGDHAECSLEQGPSDGQKRPLKTKELWAIRVRLRLEHRARDLALFNQQAQEM
jgi:hypothetical protein